MYSTAVVNTEFLRNFNGEATLDELAERVRAALEASRRDRCNALHHDLEAGDALMVVQARGVEIPWKQWLRENCFLSERTAMLYMQLARHREEIEAEIERVGDLSLRAAVRLISKPAKSTKATKNKTKDKQTKSERASPFDALSWWRNTSNDEHQCFFKDVGFPGVQAAIPPSWGSLADDTQTMSPLLGWSTACLLDLLQSRLEADGINASVQLRKIREHINRKPPKMTIDLKAVSAAGKA